MARSPQRGSEDPAARGRRSAVAFILFFTWFVALLVFVSYFYLIPALQAAGAVKSEAHLGPATRAAAVNSPEKVQLRTLAAHASLVLSVVLFILLVGLLLTFRIGRFFRPRDYTRPKPTQYIDAWEESARRMKVPERDEPADDE